MIEPLRMSFEVGCSALHAFEVWTAKTSRWWPRDHTMTRERKLHITFEPRVGGRIFERTADGHEQDWGRITVWDPPRRLGYLWHIATDAASATDVEITFHDVADGMARIDIVHAGWERLGERGQPWRDANRGGWGGVLPHYQAACAEPWL